MKKIYCIVWGKYRKQKTLKIIYSQKKQFVLLFTVSVAIKIKKIFKEEESIEILKILDLI